MPAHPGVSQEARPALGGATVGAAVVGSLVPAHGQGVLADTSSHKRDAVAWQAKLCLFSGRQDLFSSVGTVLSGRNVRVWG